jgi:TRAP-type C4-dicarboxylate transport system permease small subunit
MEKKKIGETLETIYKKFCDIEMIVCASFFIVIVTLVFVSAILRKMNMPIAWTSDVAQLLFAWLAFFGADIALRKGSLVGVGIVTEKLPGKWQHILQNFCYCLMLVFLVVIIHYGFPLAKRNWSRSFQSLTISYSWVTLSLPVSAIFMVLSIVHNMVAGHKASTLCACKPDVKEA